MTFAARDNSGALFRSRDSDGYDGRATVNGAEYVIAAIATAWPDGKRYFRMRFGEAGVGSLSKAHLESERGPSHTGAATINGSDYELAAWLKESARGTKYFSLAFTLKSISAPKPPKAREPSQKALKFALEEVGAIVPTLEDNDEPLIEDPIPF